MISEAERPRLHIGYKQAMRALGENKADKLFIALDTEDKIRLPLEKKAADLGIEAVGVPTMKELGAICGIDVGASCAIILKG